MTKQLKVIYTHWINTSADPPKGKKQLEEDRTGDFSYGACGAAESDYTTAGRTLQPVGAQKFFGWISCGYGIMERERVVHAI